VHHRRIELVALEFALGRDHRVADHAQTVDVRVQRAQAVRQLLRQHRNHAAREVDRRGAIQRIGIERRARPHVVRHVGNRHDQTPALCTADLDRLAIDGIVEVARILAIDRDQRNVAQVDAMIEVGLTHLIGQPLGFLDGSGRELMRHAVLAHGDLDLHAGIVDIAKHLDHAAHRLHVAIRPFHQFDADHLPHARLALGLGRNQDVLADALVFRRHHQHAVFDSRRPITKRLARSTISTICPSGRPRRS
jgi:hypothetical protein